MSGIEHGTARGYYQHRRRGEPPCRACCGARHAAEYRPHPLELRPCGTEAAYRRHRRRGEQACEACLVAHRAVSWQPQYRKSRQARREQQRGAA